jgi:hypothetical protein
MQKIWERGRRACEHGHNEYGKCQRKVRKKTLGDMKREQAVLLCDGGTLNQPRESKGQHEEERGLIASP